ncbi:TRAP dicarboxylate transporter, DctQ subunit [Fulvimarina pelagi HTCC2506]|uniref:TRAP transporter small permease protein n=1 Tax=Fulvimarina pelagi HTCC2506 TaxID=314231 RepID=Q0FY46_9HYPH|nr:TRAP dicarboxylate transporter, DctQ subunit [Fulvimarina pelagi HTCC2506]
MDGRTAVRTKELIVFRFIDRLLEFACSFLLVEIVVFLFANVLARYVFAISFHWADEMVRYSFTWLAFLSGALVMRYGGHMAMDMFTDAFPSRIARSLRIGIELAVIVFLVVLTIYSWQMAQIAEGQRSSTLRISMIYVYLSAPVGCAFMLYYSLRRLAGFVMGHDTMKLDEQEAAQ